MAKQESIREAFAEALPLGFDALFYHLSTPPSTSSALFAASPGQVEEKTLCESHFLAVSLPSNITIVKELFVFAIEVLVYTTRGLTTIFVSKADSTGYLHLSNPKPKAPSALKTICTRFLSFLISQHLHGARVLLSLFARSQNQYLFPGSIENPGKHVLDDRQLIKWWCRTLDPVLRQYSPPPDAAGGVSADFKSTSEAYVVVPGCDGIETRAFFPLSSRTGQMPRWENRYPVELIAPDVSAPARCRIPRFPDDPKARFVKDLEGDIAQSGKWRSVQSLDQFWEMMSYRQECSAGRLVGFVWLIFNPHSATKTFSCFNGEDAQTSKRSPSPRPNWSQADDHNSVPSNNSANNQRSELTQTASSYPTPQTQDDQDHISQCQNPRSPKEDGQETQADNPDDLLCKAKIKQPLPFRWPHAPGGHLVTGSDYESLMTHLLEECDFSTEALAASSTASWIAKASSMLAAEPTAAEAEAEATTRPVTTDWAIRITGRNPINDHAPAPAPAPAIATNPEQEGTSSTSNPDRPSTTPKVNVLTGVLRKKKKRKINTIVDDGEDDGHTAADDPIPTQDQGVDTTHPTPTVELGTGLAPPVALDPVLPIDNGDGKSSKKLKMMTTTEAEAEAEAEAAAAQEEETYDQVK